MKQEEEMCISHRSMKAIVGERSVAQRAPRSKKFIMNELSYHSGCVGGAEVAAALPYCSGCAGGAEAAQRPPISVGERCVAKHAPRSKYFTVEERSVARRAPRSKKFIINEFSYHSGCMGGAEAAATLSYHSGCTGGAEAAAALSYLSWVRDEP